MIHGVSSIPGAREGSLVFAEDETSLGAALASAAAAVLVGPGMASAAANKPLLRVGQPRLAFAHAAVLLRAPQPAAEIHATAVLAPGVEIGRGVSIGAQAVIDEGAALGEATVIGSGAVIGAGVHVGNDCRIYPRVVIYPGVTLGNRVIVHAGAMASYLVGLAMSVLDGNIANTALPSIATQLHASPAASIWVVNAFLLTVGICVVPLSSLVDIIGYKKVYQGGLILFTIASAGCSLPHSLSELVLARVCQGVGAACIWSTSAAVMRYTYPRALLGRGIGLGGFVVFTAAAAGPQCRLGNSRRCDLALAVRNQYPVRPARAEPFRALAGAGAGFAASLGHLERGAEWHHGDAADQGHRRSRHRPGRGNGRR